MPRFKYRATDSFGKIITGIVESHSTHDLLEQLKNKHLYMIYCRRLRFNHPKIMMLRSQKLNLGLIDLCLHFESMDHSGIPLLEILSDAIHVIKHQKLSQTLLEIRAQVQEGSSLSGALANFPQLFDTIFVQMVKVSEKTGHLYKAFHELAKYLEWEETTKSNLYKAIRYPIFVTTSMLLAFVTLANILLPQLKQFLAATNTCLPWSTQLLFYLSEQCIPILLWTIPVLMTILSLAYFFRYASDRWCLFIDRIVLKVPVLGTCYNQIAYSRFFHCFAITFSSGIDLLHCLELSTESISNRYLVKILTKVRLSIQDGHSIAESFSVSQLASVSTQRLLYAGEATGQLAQFLLRIRNQYEMQVKRKVDTLISSIEPALLLMSGAFLLWIVLAIFHPIYTSLTIMEY